MVWIQTLSLGVFELLTVRSWEDVSWKVHQTSCLLEWSKMAIKSYQLSLYPSHPFLCQVYIWSGIYLKGKALGQKTIMVQSTNYKLL